MHIQDLAAATAADTAMAMAPSLLRPWHPWVPVAAPPLRSPGGQRHQTATRLRRPLAVMRHCLKAAIRTRRAPAGMRHHLQAAIRTSRAQAGMSPRRQPPVSSRSPAPQWAEARPPVGRRPALAARLPAESASSRGQAPVVLAAAACRNNSPCGSRRLLPSRQAPVMAAASRTSPLRQALGAQGTVMLHPQWHTARGRQRQGRPHRLEVPPRTSLRPSRNSLPTIHAGG
mmetsp:Transcript_129759/g.361481  ORF Transcript_129759/g.361481 Transcript_129759/m.361481 type:complete len:229 (-) Transcript_129759:1489-2175(-)